MSKNGFTPPPPPPRKKDKEPIFVSLAGNEKDWYEEEFDLYIDTGDGVVVSIAYCNIRKVRDRLNAIDIDKCERFWIEGHGPLTNSE